MKYKVKLRVTSQDGSRKKYSFHLEEGKRFYLGKEPAGLKLSHSPMDAQYCFLNLGEAGLTVTDAHASSTGLYLNNEHIQQHGVKAGDILIVGEFAIEFLEVPAFQTTEPKTQFLDIQDSDEMSTSGGAAAVAAASHVSQAPHAAAAHAPQAERHADAPFAFSGEIAPAVTEHTNSVAMEVPTLSKIMEAHTASLALDTLPSSSPELDFTPASEAVHGYVPMQEAPIAPTHEEVLAAAAAEEIQVKAGIEDERYELETSRSTSEIAVPFAIPESDFLTAPDTDSQPAFMPAPTPVSAAPLSDDEMEKLMASTTFDASQETEAPAAAPAPQKAAPQKAAGPAAREKEAVAVAAPAPLELEVSRPMELMEPSLAPVEARFEPSDGHAEDEEEDSQVRRREKKKAAAKKEKAPRAPRQPSRPFFPAFQARAAVLGLVVGLPLLGLGYFFMLSSDQAPGQGMLGGKFDELKKAVVQSYQNGFGGSAAPVAEPVARPRIVPPVNRVAVQPQAPAQVPAAQVPVQAAQQPPVQVAQTSLQVQPQAGLPGSDTAAQGAVRPVGRTVASATPPEDGFALSEFFFAIEAGNSDVVRSLLYEKNLDPNSNNAQGASALMMAAANGHIEVARLLITKGAMVNGMDRHGTTPLMWAAFKGHQNMVEYLVKQGADTKLARDNGDTAYLVAKRWGRTEIASFLKNPSAYREKKKQVAEAESHHRKKTSPDTRKSVAKSKSRSKSSKTASSSSKKSKSSSAKERVPASRAHKSASGTSMRAPVIRAGAAGGKRVSSRKGEPASGSLDYTRSSLDQ